VGWLVLCHHLLRDRVASAGPVAVARVRSRPKHPQVSGVVSLQSFKVGVFGNIILCAWIGFEKFHLTPRGGRYGSDYWFEIASKILAFMKFFSL
jgi:hypothetical protein